MRRAVLALTVLAALPATASAAPFGELPFLPVSGSASCVQAPGAPGLLSRSADGGVRFMQAGPAGLTDGDLAKLPGALFPCGAVAVAPSGAGAIAGPTVAGGRLPFHVAAILRDPGGAWGKAQTLARDSAPPATLVAAASARGDAAVAWTDSRDIFTGPYKVKLARRAPGGTFGRPVTVFTSAAADPAPSVRMAYAAGGELVVAWTRRDSSGLSLDVATAPAGGPLGAPQRVGQIRGGAAPALAVAPDGSALLAYAAGTEVRVAERAPGGAFGAPVKVATADDVFTVETQAALAPGGAAVVGWQSVVQEGAGMAARAGPGAFGAPVALARNRTIPAAVAKQIAEILTVVGDVGSLSGLEGRLRVALAGDSAIAAWTRMGRPGGLRALELHAATLPLAGGRLELQTLGTGLRDVDSATPVVLPDGRGAVAWGDDGPLATRGRVHLAIAGAPPAAPAPAPVVRIGPPRERVLGSEDSLLLPVSCSAACDVRVQRAGRSETEALLSLPGAGRRTLAVEPRGGPIAHLRRGPIRFRVATGPPGGPATVRTVTFTLRRRPPAPTPRVLDLTAVRHGDSVVVTWRTDHRAQGFAFIVAGERRHSIADEPVAAAPGRGSGRRFHATLRQARRVRWVYVIYIGGSREGKPTSVRVP